MTRKCVLPATGWSIKMEEVKMVNDFTMGWCIECHRTTGVDMSNPYYKKENYEKCTKSPKKHMEKRIKNDCRNYWRDRMWKMSLLRIIYKEQKKF